MKRVRFEQEDDLTTESINSNPTKRRRVQSNRIRNRRKHTNNGYHSDSNDSDNEYIELINNYIKSIESMENTQFQQCVNTVCNEYETKSLEITSQLKQTEICINNKYEYESEIIHNEYNESIDRAKKKLIAKYNEKKCKHERLLKNHFQKHLQQKSMANNDSPFFEKEEKNIYQRTKLIAPNHANILNNNQFFDPILQNKWSKMRSVPENDLQHDVNKCLQQTNELQIKDILSTFPLCDVEYKSNENILEIGGIILKVQTPIAVQYNGQCILYGKVYTISNKDLWCKLRRKGDKLAQYSLCCIKIQEIEQGMVKIKLM